ncbi:DnaD domain-containing protein [Paraliobacillus sp. JSM ZJ581]|uniref:DnaD domain-containing protein n=1 Tax=Paraliobacillus sp. JSM ZJ581 TaxID=3342118 RepID=UPI0035A87D0B
MKRNYTIQTILQDQLSIPSKLLTQYHRIGLEEKELIIILKIFHYQSVGVFFPTPEELALETTFDQQECSGLLRKLIQKGLLLIEESVDDGSPRNEQYSIEPLWDMLYNQINYENEQKLSQDQMNIFVLFEQEFGRALSPIEIETINIWIDDDNQQPALIKAALREAVLMSKLNFKYIDRILREWKRKGIQSVDEARAHSKAFHSQQSQLTRKPQSNKRDTSLYYNWLEED